MTDRELLELCKTWFSGIIDKCDRLTTGNVSHQKAVIKTTSKECINFIDTHLKKEPANIDYIAMWEAAAEEYHTKGYSEGEYCHEQSFIWGFQEGVDWLEKNYTITPKQKELTKEEIEEILFCLVRVAEIADKESEFRTNLIHKLNDALDCKR